MARQIRVRKTRKASKAAKSSFSALLGALMVLGLVAMMSVPALAAPKADHQSNGQSEEHKAAKADETNQAGAASDHDGDADSSSDTAYTEDNDTNDGGTPNNVSDDGDNAHPSGKDRSVEHGGSGTQGKSESNPDDSKGPMRYEGAIGDDKPNGPGGTDLADQDGNNGCGNDDDFNDDNNGWCGRKTKPAPKPAPSVEVAPSTDAVLPAEEAKVCPAGTDKAGVAMENLENCNEDDVLGRTDNAAPEVLGKVITRDVPEVAPLTAQAAPKVLGSVLPFTGGAILTYLFAGLGLLAGGILAVRAAK
jgi:hypothetical protein